MNSRLLRTAARVVGLILGLAMLGGCFSSNKEPNIDRQKVATSYLNLARGYISEGMPERAIKPLQRVLEVDKNSAEANALLATVYQLQGESGLAETYFIKALKQKPEASDIHNNYGAFLFAEGRLDEAWHQFGIASADVHYSERSRAYANLGLVMLAKSRLYEAEQHFRKALRLNRNLGQVQLELASLLYRRQAYREAQQHYTLFRRGAPQTAASLWLGIRLARVLGLKDDEASYALLLTKRYPQSAEAKEYLKAQNYDK
ncbi:type IV pilus biogenesis/stability protein PilW [Spongorhabdus nitratireducens]